KSPATYLYNDGDHYHFMDSATYDQVPLDASAVEDVLPYLKEGNEVSILRYQDSVIGVELPITVNLAVKQTDPGLRGDTVSGATRRRRGSMRRGSQVSSPLGGEVPARSGGGGAR